MGESVILPEPQQKPSRFQFVPVPGEFSRGRWKCRDSVRPYAETLEFDKSSSKDEPNPNKISVSRKLTRQNPADQLSDTFQVTSVENNNKEMMDDSNNVESVIITRKNGVTIVRKTSGSMTPDTTGYDKVKELSINEMSEELNKTTTTNRISQTSMVPPTPMNTPPMSLSQPVVISPPCSSETYTTSTTLSPTSANSEKPVAKPRIFQVQAVKDSSITEPTRKYSHENAVLQPYEHVKLVGTNSSASSFANLEMSQSYSSTVPAKHFQIQAVSEEQHLKAEKINEATDQLGPLSPTFQVLQTEDRKNMSLDSIDSVIDRNCTGSDVLEYEQQPPPPTTPTTMTTGGVTITVSTTSTDRKEGGDSSEKSETSASVGIPIAGGSMPNAPHSTPYGTPKDAGQRSPIVTTSADDSTMTMMTTTLPSQSILSVVTDTSTSAAAAQLMPIDNKIEQAMELVKTHLTYAVREEVDTLKNTILELEYQLRESQYESSFYRQNVTAELVEQAATYVHQQMQKHTLPSRRASSTAGTTGDGGSTPMNPITSTQSSTHMRNLQNQIQQKIPHYSQRNDTQQH